MDKAIQLPVLKILEDIASLRTGKQMILFPAAFYHEEVEYVKSNHEQVQVSPPVPMFLLII